MLRHQETIVGTHVLKPSIYQIFSASDTDSVNVVSKQSKNSVIPYCRTASAQVFYFNPLDAGVAYMRVFIFYEHITYHFLNMLKKNMTSISNIWKQFTSIFFKSE